MAATCRWLLCHTMTFVNPGATLGSLQHLIRLINGQNLEHNWTKIIRVNSELWQATNSKQCTGCGRRGRWIHIVATRKWFLCCSRGRLQAFPFIWPCCIVTNFFVLKPTICINSTNLFCHETLHVSDSSSAHHQELIHCTFSNGICHTGFEQEHKLMLESCLQTCKTHTIAECTVNKLLMMDRGTVRNF
jgi:hypothetical protein